MVVYYNKRLFDRFNVAYPDESWTWDTFIDAGKRLTVDEDGDGAKEFFGAANFPRQVFVRSFGGEEFGPDGEFLLDRPESIEGLRLYIDLINKHGVFPSPSETRTQAPQQMFETGRLAMFCLGIWSVPSFRRIDRFEWDIAIMPSGPRQVTAVTAIELATAVATAMTTTRIGGPRAAIAGSAAAASWYSSMARSKKPASS